MIPVNKEFEVRKTDECIEVWFDHEHGQKSYKSLWEMTDIARSEVLKEYSYSDFAYDIQLYFTIEVEYLTTIVRFLLKSEDDGVA